MTCPPRPDRTPSSDVRALPRPFGTALLGFGIAATLLVAMLALNAMRNPALLPLSTPAAPAAPSAAEV